MGDYIFDTGRAWPAISGIGKFVLKNAKLFQIFSFWVKKISSDCVKKYPGQRRLWVKGMLGLGQSLSQG